MKLITLIISLLLFHCLIDARIDWDNNSKLGRNLAYTHPHEGNLTKAEIQNNPETKNDKDSNGNELYRIKGQDELNPPMGENCFSKVSHCISACNREHDPTSTIWAFKAAYVKSKRGFCIDTCYNELGHICNNFQRRTRY